MYPPSCFLKTRGYLQPRITATTSPSSENLEQRATVECRVKSKASSLMSATPVSSAEEIWTGHSMLLRWYTSRLPKPWNSQSLSATASPVSRIFSQYSWNLEAGQIKSFKVSLNFEFTI